MTDPKSPTLHPDWWTASLNRRELGAVALGALALVGLGGASGCCDDDAAEDVDADALEAQKAHGWDVGNEDTPLSTNGARAKDSRDSEAWKGFLTPATLLGVLQPSEPWRPYNRLTLVQSLEQPTLAKQLTPAITGAAEEMHRRAHALASLVRSSKDPGKTLMVFDMAGPESVALAAGMADVAEPLFFFDNWPHPYGVVRSHETLGALLYYAAEFKEAQAKRTGERPIAMVLDAQRLSPYSDDEREFDNRYVADLPKPEELKRLGIERIMYVTATKKDEELDDLNDLFVDYDKAEIPVAMIAMDAFERDGSGLDTPTRGYYYGGSPHSHTYFYHHYPSFWYVPLAYYAWSSPSSAIAPSRVPAPSYKPAPRATVFSSRTTGTTTGVGKTKPTGFGRVSTRVSSDGSVSRTSYSRSSSRSSSSSGGSSSGRSGSWGRSRSSSSSS